MGTVDTTYLLLFAANLAFIVTHLYGWLLKWHYRPRAYSENFSELFPAQRSVGVIYLFQLCELPYLFRVGHPDALLYANAFALLFFAVQMLIMCELYFFPRNVHPLRDYWIVLPAAFVLLPLLLQAVGVVELPRVMMPWLLGGVALVYILYMYYNVRMALRIGRALRQADEQTYADSDDFPVHFARYIQWVPTTICVLLAFNFVANDPWVKFVRDLLFILAGTAFCIYTLNPRRSLSPICAQLPLGSNRIDDVRCNDLCATLERLLSEEHIFTEPHITRDLLMQRLGINATYLTEVIQRSGYSSFYDMINQHRVRHAIALIHRNPDERLADIAEQCGFSSQASMTKAFKTQGKPTPSSFRQL